MSFEEIRYVITAVSGGIGILVDILFGGWSDGLAVLLVLMGIDYISGLIVAGVFHKSSKSKDGRLESKVSTLWTQKGRLMIHELLKKRGIKAICEEVA